ncbi:hypothetical protein DBV15_11930 [Temnothorax longispinosus]|uniref:BED-type domain-containing protein n=1 Tax=Temnothorax longispinosus TaxID=300112 RepID=A0A4S2KLJ7_9HYME|nr:hypothetical protein DBV15_11930 [Temnothorax longispinosus]
MECGEKIEASLECNFKKKLRTHLGNKHGEYPDKWHSELSEELQQYYTGSNECRATCRICGKVYSYLYDYGTLHNHKKRGCSIRRNQNTIMQSPIIQISNNQNEPCTSSSTGYITNAERQSQSPPDLPVQSFVQATEETGAHDESDTELDVTSYEEP